MGLLAFLPSPRMLVYHSSYRWASLLKDWIHILAEIHVQVAASEENCRQLELLLQVSEEELKRLRHGKVLDLSFTGVIDSEAMFIVTKAVSNHGFSLTQEKEKEEQPKPSPAPKAKEETPKKGKEEHGSK